MSFVFSIILFRTLYLSFGSCASFNFIINSPVFPFIIGINTENIIDIINSPYTYNLYILEPLSFFVNIIPYLF